jgi:hypothetical protein
VVRTGLLQHVIEYAGASRGRSRTLRAGSTARASSTLGPADEAYAIATLRMPWGELWFGNHALPRGSGRHRASGRVALRGDARGPTSLHPRLSRALAGSSSALWR